MATVGILKTTEKPKKTRPPKKVNKFDFERNARTIFVGNLPSKLDQKDVAKMFKDCGPVESARIRSVVPEKEKLPPKVAQITKRIHPKVDSVNGYVVFKSNENDQCVKKALAMNGRLVDGHHIRVDRAQRPKAKRETMTSRKKSIFVGNLRFDIRDDDLINHFEKKVGSVNYVRLVRDRSSGLGKGFGFVAFHDRASVKKALELNESDFKGRNIRVKKVEEEDEKKAKKARASKQADKVATKEAESNGDHDDDHDDDDDDDDDEEEDNEDDDANEDDEGVESDPVDHDPSEDHEEVDEEMASEDGHEASKRQIEKPGKLKNKPKKEKLTKDSKRANLGVKLANKKKNRTNFAKKAKTMKGKKKFGKRKGKK